MFFIYCLFFICFSIDRHYSTIILTTSNLTIVDVLSDESWTGPLQQLLIIETINKQNE